MTVITYRQAITRAIAEEMERDDNIVLLGEDIAAAGGVFKTTAGLLEQFGPKRVRDTPISEQAIIGAAIGAALTGLRPVAELMFADFAGVAFDQLANQLAKFRYMTGGQIKTPVTVRLSNGAGLGFAAQHSQCSENWFLNIPGLHIAVPGTPRDLLGLLKSAIRSDDAVMIFEHKALFNMKQEISDDEEVVIPLGSGVVVREGSDVTLAATQVTRLNAEAAAQSLEERGISVEIIDPRTLVPSDFDLIKQSVTKTGAFVAVCEGPHAGSWAATLVARVASECFPALRTAPVVVSSPETPVPFAETLEKAWVPSAKQIVKVLEQMTAV